MPRLVSTLAAAVAAVALHGCILASATSLTPTERRKVQRTLRLESDRFLRISFHLTPFYGDDTRRLLTPNLPEEIPLPQPDGEPLYPEPVLKILPAGTPAKILDVEFPSLLRDVDRLLDTPRSLPRVILGVKGEPADTPLVLLLRPDFSSPEDVEAEVDRYLSKTDVHSLLEGLPEGMKTAIKTKTAMLDMPATVLEMVWGYPELKEIELGEEEGERRETWIYPGGLRRAVLVDERVISVVPEPR